MGDVLVATSAEDGRVLWTRKLKGDLEAEGGHLGAPPVAVGDELVVATLSGEVLRIDRRSGNVKRRYQVGSPMRFPPIIDEGRIYVGTQDGQIVCIETAEPKLTGWPTWGGNPAHAAIGQ